MSDLFRQEALDNRRERLWGEVVLVQPLSFWLLTGFITLVVLLIALLLVYGTYARRENVKGFLLPDKGLIKIYATERGLVRNVHVEEGDHVEAGDLLFTISTGKGDEQSADLDSLILQELLENKAALGTRREERRELDALASSRQRERIPRLEREIRQLEKLLVIHEERLRVSREQLARVEQLSDGQFVSKAEMIAARETHVAIELRTAEARQELEAKRDELIDIKNTLAELPLQASLDLAELDERLSAIDQQILETGGRRAYTLRAPASGRVTALQATIGQRVQAERPLLTILPADARFHADLFVPTRAIGFIEPGQSVLLRYSAFPYQQFGIHEGTVEKVTQTILLPNELDVPVQLEEPVYRVSVVPKEQTITAYGRELDLQAGMLLEASILLEGRSLGEWLLAPIYSLRGSL